MSSSSSQSSSSWSTTGGDDDSALRLKRRRSALFHLGIAPSAKGAGEGAAVPSRFYVQVRFCNNGAVLSTELKLVSGDRPLLDALRPAPGRRTGPPCAVYVDPGALHEPFQPVDRLLRVQDLDTSIAAAVHKWHCFKFIVDFDATAPPLDDAPDAATATSPEVVSVASDRFYSVNELPVIDLSDFPRRPSPPPPKEERPEREGQHDRKDDHGKRLDDAKPVVVAVPAPEGSPKPRPAKADTPVKARLFAKAPAHLVNKRRESAEKQKAAAAAASLLSPAAKIRRLSFDAIDLVTVSDDQAERTVLSVSSSSEEQDVKPNVTAQARPKLATSRPRAISTRTLRVTLAKEPVAGSIYNSIVAAAKDAGPGDQIVVSSGVYREKSTVELRSNVTLRAANGAAVGDVVIIGRSVSFATIGIRGDNVAVQGITIRKNRSKSKSSYPAIIDTDAKIQNFLLIECCVDGNYDRESPDKQAQFQGVFFDIETSGRIENCMIENIPDHAIVANPDGMVHVTGGAVRRVLFSAVRVAKRCFKKGQKPYGVCVFLNGVAIEEIDEKLFDADPGQISINGSVNAGSA